MRSRCIQAQTPTTWCEGCSGLRAVRTLRRQDRKLPLSVYVTPADMHDTQGARRLLAGLKYFVPRLKMIWADAAYRGQDLADWCKAEGDWDLDVVERAAGVRGFAVVPKRRIVEAAYVCRASLVFMMSRLN